MAFFVQPVTKNVPCSNYCFLVLAVQIVFLLQEQQQWILLCFLLTAHTSTSEVADKVDVQTKLKTVVLLQYLWWRIGLFAVHITCVLFSSSAHMALDIKVFSSRFSSSPSYYCRQGTTTLLHCCCMRVMRLWYDDTISYCSLFSRSGKPLLI